MGVWTGGAPATAAVGGALRAPPFSNRKLSLAVPSGHRQRKSGQGRTGDGRRWRCPEGTAVFQLKAKFGGALRAPPTKYDLIKIKSDLVMITLGLAVPSGRRRTISVLFQSEKSAATGNRTYKLKGVRGKR